MAIHRKLRSCNLPKQTPKTNYAYIAGIIDGEGCISIIKAKNNRACGYEWQLRIAVTNNSIRIIKKLIGVFGGRFQTRIRDVAKHKQFVWYLYGKKACEMLKKVKPYLQEKKEQADLAIKFNISVSQRIMKKSTKKMTEKDIKTRDYYYQRMRDLKTEYFIPLAPAETKRNDTFLGEAIVHTN